MYMAAPRADGPFTRLTGSELLLKKLPLYAKARLYSAVDVSQPTAECNTLNYGPDVYPVLGLIRASEYLGKEGGVSTSSFVPHALGEPFSGIHISLSDASLRKWHTHSEGKSNGNAPLAVAKTASANCKMKAALLNSAVSPPTHIEVVHPLVGGIVKSLEKALTATKRESKRASTQKLEGDKLQEKVVRNGAPGSKRLRREGEGPLDADAGISASPLSSDEDEVSSTGHNSARSRGETDEESAPSFSIPATRLQQYERNLVAYYFSSDTEKQLVAAVRDSRTAAGSNKTAVATASSRETSAALPTMQWESMVSLVSRYAPSQRFPTQNHPSSSPSDAALEKRSDSAIPQEVRAYLKRVVWIEKQRRVDNLGPRQGLTWAHLSESQRAQQEMQRAIDQRGKYSRSRRTDKGKE